MKHIKQYEELNNKPQIGDYAIVEPNSDRTGLSQHWRDFLKCHIGKIVRKHYYTYRIEFEITLGTETLSFREAEIIDFSKNKEDLSYVEDANKFNL